MSTTIENIMIVKCMKHDEKCTFKGMFDGLSLRVISVEPCKQCIKEAYEKGRQDGIKESGIRQINT